MRIFLLLNSRRNKMNLEELHTKRRALQKELNSVGIMRSGSLSIRYQKCSKARCICKSPGHPGHGPIYSYSIKDEQTNKTIIRNYQPGRKLEKLQEEIENYHRYKQLQKEYVQINNEICKLREEEGEEKREGEAEIKKNSSKK